LSVVDMRNLDFLRRGALPTGTKCILIFAIAVSLSSVLVVCCFSGNGSLDLSVPKSM
jgi:hypothetical protein